MKNNRRASAFSLIEISIVIIIIGILVAGVTQGSRLLNQAKLSSAKTLTRSAPVTGIKNLSLWIESTSDESFHSADLDDATMITTWNDINPQTVTKANLTDSTSNLTRPTYRTNIINGLPAVLFDGTDDFLSTTNFSNISTAATVFAVVRFPSTISATPATRAILSKRTAAGPTVNIEFGNGTTITGWNYSDGTVDAPTALPGGNLAASTAYVASVVYTANSATGCGNTSTGYAFFHNGAVNASTCGATNGATPTAVSDPLFIGKQGLTTSPTFFSGHIGEIIIFDRALKKEERQSIEAYLGKKWGIAMTVASY